MPVPRSGEKYVGVSGSPLPVVIWLVNVQSLNNRPLQPSSSVPPTTPAPVVYSNVRDDLVPLIEARSRVLRLEVEPVLREHRRSWSRRRTPRRCPSLSRACTGPRR